MAKRRYHKFISLSKVVSCFVVLCWVIFACSNQKKYPAVDFWNNIDFSSSNLEKQKVLLDSLLVDFIILLDETPQTDANIAIHKAMSKAKESPFIFNYFVKKLDYHLYHPNSVLRNDLYYEEVLKYVVSSNNINQVDKIRYKNRLELVQQNQKGKKANNFNFVQSDGVQRDLYSFKNTCKIIVFYDPNCNICKEVLPELESVGRIAPHFKNKNVALLTVCPVGEEKYWQEFQANLPQSWVNGYNKGEEIIRNNLYDLKAFPTFYLIDEDNRVLLKDAEIKHLVSYIQSWT